MKSLMIAAMLLIGATALASSDVKITSFKFLDHGSHFSPGAELCGELTTPLNKPVMVKIVSDPEEKSPGNYYTWTGPEGKFCAVIATYTGKADAELQK